MFAAIGLTTCPSLAVPAEVMRHVVDVESGANSFAIGVVGGRLERQPKNLAEALATVRMLDAKGYNYSLGVAQVNRANLGKFGLDSYEKAFDTCSNLAAGAKILAACYASSGGNWGKAFSCYYSGNFVTGYRDGYVQKVYDSINRDRITTTRETDAQAIPLESPSATTRRKAISHDQPGYRMSMRSVALQAATPPTPSRIDASTHLVGSMPKLSLTPAGAFDAAISAQVRDTPTSQVFEPSVTGPNDLSSRLEVPKKTAAPQVTATPTGHGDPTTAAQESRDAAFVF